MCGKVDHAGERSTPGATSSSPRAPRRAATPDRWRRCRSSRSWSTPSAPRSRRRRRRNLRRPRSRGGTRPRRRRRLGRHALHRDARGEGTSRLQGPPPRDAEDGTTISRAFSGRPCACCATPTRALRRAPRRAQGVPEQLWQSLSDGPSTSVAARTRRRRPEREGYPAGQGVGASTSWSRRGLVARMVAEAELLSGRRPLPQLGGRSSSSVVASAADSSLPREPLTSHR